MNVSILWRTVSRFAEFAIACHLILGDEWFDMNPIETSAGSEKPRDPTLLFCIREGYLRAVSSV